MPRLCYKDMNFRKATLEMIERANDIITEYADEGYDLTVRQVYYQFVSKDWISNTETSYNKLQSTLSNARLSGLIDWNHIVDRTRKMEQNSHWNSPREILEICAEQFQLDVRLTQDVYIEVWVEKDALLGIVERVSRENDVPYMSCRGYASHSVIWRAAQRCIEEEESGRETVIIQLSDHDPSGVDMSGDLQRRMVLFGSSAEVERIALTMDQINKFNPPPNPAKITDSRYEAYQEEYGEESWELDALDPREITHLIQEAIDKHTEPLLIEEEKKLQRQYKRQLRNLANNWTESEEDEEEE